MVLIVDPTDSDALAVANHYIAVRGIPASNVLYIDPAAADHAAFAATRIPALVGSLDQRGIADHADYVVISATDRFFIPVSSTITDGCSPVTRLALPACYTTALMASDILAGLPVTTVNQFWSAVYSPRVFDSQVSYLGGVASSDPSARRYFIGAQLGYTGSRGNSVEEILALIDRSAAADGSRPAGTFYFMNNTADPARNVRAAQFAPVVAGIQGLGYGAEIVTGAALPQGEHDILGVMTGVAAPPVIEGAFTILPGAFADHLTSWAATFDQSAQTKLSEWLAKGASASFGAVEEPCNYTGKFPHARIHQYYAEGSTIGEAYLRSATFAPFQGFFAGDPVTRAFAHVPTVTAMGVPTGPASGAIEITPGGSTTRPGTTVILFDLLVDGVLRGTAFAGQKFTLDTTALADGWHDLRVIGYDSSIIRTAGRWSGELRVSNTGRSATLTADPPAGDLGTVFEFTAAGAGAGVAEIRVLQSGRVVAAAAGSPGVVTVTGQVLGAGASTLVAEARFIDGRVAVSDPVTVQVAAAGLTTPAAPIAYSYTKPVRADRPFVVELPASVTGLLSNAVYTIVDPPASCTILADEGGPWVVCEPAPGASGVDTLTFSVLTTAGASGLATVRLDYGTCYADCDLSTGAGVLDFFDFICFQDLFAAGDPSACDCDVSTGPGMCDFFDFVCYQDAFAAGC